jgi:hypothetical protein
LGVEFKNSAEEFLDALVVGPKLGIVTFSEKARLGPKGSPD